MITEDYVSFETAKLLKEKGFTEWCFKCYGVAVLHNGADISFDEECDLRDNGRENEIEYIEGDRLYDYGCNNREKNAKVWAAPTLWVAMKWLREVHHITIGITFSLDIITYELQKDEEVIVAVGSSRSYEDMVEEAIKCCLENLI